MSARFANSAGRSERIKGSRTKRTREESENAWRVEFSHRLRSIMAVIEIKNVDVAKSLDVSEQRVSNWMTATACPTPYQIHRFCKRYGVSPDYLFSGDVSFLRAKWADGLASVAGDRPAASLRVPATAD